MRYDYFELSDEQFLKTIRFHNSQVKKYLEKALYNFIVFYIAKGIETKAIFDNDFDRIINTAIEHFDSYQFRNSIDSKKVKKLLANKYNIIITKNYPIKLCTKK